MLRLAEQGYREIGAPGHAALAIQCGLTSLANEVRRLHGVEFRMRMGINTGRVVVGTIGWDLRMDYRKNPQWHLQF